MKTKKTLLIGLVAFVMMVISSLMGNLFSTFIKHKYCNFHRDQEIAKCEEMEGLRSLFCVESIVNERNICLGVQ